MAKPFRIAKDKSKPFHSLEISPCVILGLSVVMMWVDGSSVDVMTVAYVHGGWLHKSGFYYVILPS